MHPETTARFRLGARQSAYGPGIRQLHSGNFTFLGHSGSWGCLVYHDPAENVSICLTVNQASHGGKLDRLFTDVIPLLEKLQRK
jgi:hypothetical protein